MELPFEVTKEELINEQEGKNMQFNLNNSDDEEYERLYSVSEESVKNLITELLDDKLSSLLLSMTYCESPIERLLAVAMESIKDEYEGLVLDKMFVIDTQPEIVCGNNKYRVDFLINYVEEGNICKSIVVECDGREYHNKNKQQLEKDYKKDRMLQMSGFAVLRFSGSEITKCAVGCARDVYRYMLNVKNGYKGKVIHKEE